VKHEEKEVQAPGLSAFSLRGFGEKVYTQRGKSVLHLLCAKNMYANTNSSI